VKTTERNGNVVLTIQYDRESIVNMALKVKAEGFVPAETLKAEFGPETFTRCIAILYRDFRMFREVSRPWTDGVDVRGYEWADRRFSRPEIKKIPPDLGFLVELTTPIVAKYGEYQRVIAKCRYINEVRGGCPVKDTDGEPTNAFQRDHEGRIQILRYNLRAMMVSALPMIGKEQALARYIRFETIVITPNGNLSKGQSPVNDHGQGKGFVRSERLAPGTEFVIAAWIPTTVITIAEYLQVLKLAGYTVGLSPGRSAGFGDFEVLEALED
jgi:hypothetical protein